jgi:Uma2 family endonuclease
MYDLPSEDPKEPGLPDQFHDFQPELLMLTFLPPNYPEDRVFSASDLNLYYDVQHQNWYKRPDWFGVVGIPRLYDDKDLRLSYVIWQEGISPMVVVELLSPGTEKEDLGAPSGPGNRLPPFRGDRGGLVTGNREFQLFLLEEAEKKDGKEKPPSKWQVYEQILRIPYYIVFSRYTDQMRGFKLEGGHYQEQSLEESRIWMPELELGLGLWQGEYKGITRLWLRWYDGKGNWLPTEAEAAQQQAKQERQRAEQAEKELEQMRAYLRSLGVDSDGLE